MPAISLRFVTYFEEQIKSLAVPLLSPINQLFPAMPSVVPIVSASVETFIFSIGVAVSSVKDELYAPGSWSLSKLVFTSLSRSIKGLAHAGNI